MDSMIIICYSFSIIITELYKNILNYFDDILRNK